MSYGSLSPTHTGNSDLVSFYYSVVVLIPDTLDILEHVLDTSREVPYNVRTLLYVLS